MSSSAKEPKVVVIAGPNGAGKSTLAPFLLRDTFGLLEYVNADTIALGLSAFQPETAAIEAGRIMLRRLHQLAGHHVSFAFESTLAGRSYAKWLEDLRRNSHQINILLVWLRAPELAIERVRERVARGGHNIPEEVIRRRYIKSCQNFYHLYRQLADTWAVYDNSSSEETVLVATGYGAEPEIVSDPKRWRSFRESTK